MAPGLWVWGMIMTMQSTPFTYAVSLAKLQIDFEHVDKLLCSQSSKRRRNIILQDLVDLVADRCRITIGVGGPL